MRVTGPWNKIPKSEYNKMYYATDISKDTYLEWSRRDHFRSEEYTYGFMRHANSKFTTLTEALKSGIALAKSRRNAYIFKGDNQIGVISLPEKRMNYSAIYTAGNKKMFLNRDGTVFEGESKAKKIIKAHIKFLPWSGGTYDGGIIEAYDMNDLRRKIFHEYAGTDPLNKVVVYVDNKEIACIIAYHSDRWTWWPIHGTMQSFNVFTGYIVKE